MFAGVMSLGLVGCGAQADDASPDREPGEAGKPGEAGGSEEVGVSTSELTSCNRSELANVVVRCQGLYTHCDFRLQENNFACAEGVVGQASSEGLNGTTNTYTRVATKLFGDSFTGNNGWGAVTIATQWGHAYASTHWIECRDLDGYTMSAAYTMDPWSKNAVRAPGSTCL
jgi:hypothetical protein